MREYGGEKGAAVRTGQPTGGRGGQEWASSTEVTCLKIIYNTVNSNEARTRTRQQTRLEVAQEANSSATRSLVRISPKATTLQRHVS